jgi:hypothetical protein
MGRFLLNSDYVGLIQTDDLTQITEGVNQNLLDAETKAIARVRSRITQRYLVDIELGGMGAYDAATHYRTKDRVYTDPTIDSVKLFDRWVSSTVYVIGEIITDDDGYVYTSIQGSTNVAVTDTAYWTPMINIVNSNATYWDIGVDNRYPLFLEVVMDLALHTLYARINPRTIPDLRRDRYAESMDLLDEWADGESTAEVLDKHTDQQGLSITWGSAKTKQSNFF